jgi:plastocyanin
MTPSRRNRPSLALAAGLALVALLAACAGPSTGQLGLDKPPAELDPNSPNVSAMNVAFDRIEIDVPAARAFTLVFQNRENLAHNVSIYRDAAFKEPVFEGIVFNGPGTRWYPVPALVPGTYFFQCDIHPIDAMRGTVSAGL